MSNQRQNTERRGYRQQYNNQSKSQRLNNSNRNITWRRDLVPNNLDTRDVHARYPIATVPTGFPIVSGSILGAAPSYESGVVGNQLYNFGAGAFPPHGHPVSAFPSHGFVAHGPPSHGCEANGPPSHFLGASNPPHYEFGGPHQACPFHEYPPRGLPSHGIGVHGRPSYGFTTHGIPQHKHGFGPQGRPFPGVFLCGLPKNCRDIEIIQFFDGLEVVDVFPVFKNGIFSGEAFVIFPSITVFESALDRDMQKIGEASVEVFCCKRRDYYHAVAAGMNDGVVMRDSILKICGEPYFADKKMVIDFFVGCNLSEDRVHILCDLDGQPTGEIHLEFTSKEDARKAMDRNKTAIGSHLVEIFPFTPEESRSAYAEPTEDSESHMLEDLLKRSRCMLKIRGEPYFADKKMIIDFFGGCNLSEERVHILCHPDGQPSGEIHLEFRSEEDVRKAMSMDKTTIGSHLVENFPFTPEELRAVDTAPSQDRKSHDKPHRKKDRAAPAVASQVENAAPKGENSHCPDQPGKPNKEELFTPILRLCNVPPSCDMHDIIDFFGDFNLTLDRLQVVCRRNGVATGEVYVEFDSAEDAKKALSKNKIKILNKCVHICPSSPDKARQAMSSR